MNWDVIIGIFGIIGGIAAVVAIPLAIRALKKAKLTYAFDKPVEIISLEQATRSLRGLGILDVKYNDVPVSSMFALRCRLRNSGNKAISNEQVYSPVKISFSPEVRLLDVALEKTEPESMKTSLSLEDNGVEIEFNLLNSESEIYITFLFEEIPSVLRVDAYIADVSNPDEESWDRGFTKAESRISHILLNLLVFTMSIQLFLCIILYLLNQFNRLSVENMEEAFPSVIFSFIFSSALLFVYIREEQKRF